MTNIFIRVTFIDKHLTNYIVENHLKNRKTIEKILVKDATIHKETTIKS